MIRMKCLIGREGDLEQQSFFEREDQQPLAARLRPQTLEEYAGQTGLE